MNARQLQQYDEEEKRKKRRLESEALTIGWDGNGSFVPYSAPVIETIPDSSGYSGGGGSFGGGGASGDYGSCDSGSGGGDCGGGGGD